MSELTKFDIKSFKNLIDSAKFQKIKIDDIEYINLNSITPFSYLQNTLQNRIFILLNTFIYGSFINNPNPDITSTSSTYDSLEDNIPEDILFITYKHFNTTIYSNIICNLVYLIINYVCIELLESNYNLTKKENTATLDNIYKFSSEIINNILESSYKYFTDFLDKIYTDLKTGKTIDIIEIENFMKQLFNRYILKYKIFTRYLILIKI